jgi:hypothetical protein
LVQLVCRVLKLTHGKVSFTVCTSPKHSVKK